MLKHRIIAVLLLKDGIVVQSIGFSKYLPVGSPSIAIQFLNDWGVDEIIILDISATVKSLSPDIELIKSLAKFSLVPLTIGGGVSNITDVHMLLENGADKVCFNTASLSHISLLQQASSEFGNQCVVASIDAIHTSRGYQVFDYKSKVPLNLSITNFLSELHHNGIGEVFLNSVDRDGSKAGFDITMINYFSSHISVPIIVCGGAGNPSHFLEVLHQTSVNAVAAANFFHFYEHSLTITKAMAATSTPIRHDTVALYNHSSIDSNGRLLKKDENVLDDLLFTKLPKETI